MNPVAFELFGIEIRWYGVFIALGVILGTAVARKNAKFLDRDEEIIDDFVLITLPLAIIGARLYYVIFNWSYYAGDFLKIINIRLGGLAIHGGLITGVIAAIIFSKVRDIKIFDLLDIAATGVPLAQAIGRWGNYANGEAHGGPTDLPWAISVDGQMVHPTFLYESLWNIALFFMLNRLFRKNKKFKGQIFSIYLIGYSLGRFWIEGLRTDSLYWGEIRVAQLISVLMIISGVVIYFYQSSFQKKSM